MYNFPKLKKNVHTSKTMDLSKERKTPNNIKVCRKGFYMENDPLPFNLLHSEINIKMYLTPL